MRDLMRHFSLAACLLLLVSAAWAGVNDYTFTQSPGSYSTITGTQIIAAGQDNTRSTLRNIGFTFNFGGTNFTQFSASSNGFIRLGSTRPATNAYTPISTPITNTIAGAAMNGYTSGAVVFNTTGTSPNRVTTVQYTNYRLNNSNGTTDLVNFQIRLYETTNVVEIIYNNARANNSRTPQVGLRGSSATDDYANRTGNGSWASTTAGTTSGATKAWSTTYYPASGQTYKWTPPALKMEPSTITRLLSHKYHER